MNYRIKELLKGNKLSISELAESINVKRESLSRVVNGASTSVETLQKIADVLQVPITQLFEQPKENTATCPHCGKPISVKIEKE
ncbi:MAG: helix-turn-helix transcriptional regulator [Dysgonamonadaceae bacterium]